MAAKKSRKKLIKSKRAAGKKALAAKRAPKKRAAARKPTAKTGGATGLYDSTLAAYASARKSWEQGRLNIVVVMTDGRNEDPSGISRAQLLAELGKLADPHRPLPIIFVGIGPEVDNADLQGIAAATGGQAFTTADPAKINDVFYAALSRLACQPPSCG